jgi:ligand-binding sensor domain-containing protein/signal transduction histidine kinase
VRRAAHRFAIVIAVLAGIADPALGQRIPVRTYEVADGLAYSQVLHLYHDSRGYLWIATPEGLSRFDGAHFESYGVADGLPHPIINATIEDPQRRLWAATNGGGLARLAEETVDPVPARGTRRRFVRVGIGDGPGSERVNAVVFDAEGTAWCATDAGLYKGLEQNGAWTFTAALPRREVTAAMPGLAHTDGTLWFGLERDLIRVDGGTPSKVELPPGADAGDILALAQDDNGDLLVGRAGALHRRSRGGSWTAIPVPLSQTQQIRAIRPRDGAIWIATTDGLIEWRDQRVTRYGLANGLPDQQLRAIVFDELGGLWAGTWTRGLVRLTVRGVVSFTTAEGLPSDSATLVVEGRDGRVYVATEPRGLVAIEDDRVVPVRGAEAAPLGSVRRRLFHDSRGRWWIGADDGLWLAPGPSLDLRRARKLGLADGDMAISVPDSANAIAEGPDGRVWVSARPNRLLYIDAADSGPRPAVRSLAPLPNLYARLAFDRQGTLWLSSLEQVATVRDQRFEIRMDLDGLPERRARAFLADAHGRLWVGLRYEGLVVADDPARSPVRFRRIDPRGGLVSRSVWCMTADPAGRLYLGTGRGLDRFDPATGAVAHLTAGEGIAGRIATACMTDSRGRVWAGTSHGVLRFETAVEPSPHAAPRVYITRLTIAGEERHVATRGLPALPPLRLRPDETNVRVEYAGVRVGGGRLRYQYRLDGADDEWSPPTDERSVSFSRLSPGDYRLQIRAVDADGPVATATATLPFSIDTPLWRRWWALLLFGAALGGTLTAAHRLRLKQALAMERVRAQIATDLHDEVGSGLSQIAVLNEVAKRAAPSSAAALLDESATIARTLRASMGDIVWAVDPRRDTLNDLVQRMRQTTYNLLEVDGLDVIFEAPPATALDGIGLAPDRRRHLLLVLKEAVTNIARHARATRASIVLALVADRLTLAIEDDGVGVAGRGGDGRGLKNMAARAAALGGTLVVEDREGGGTRVRLDVPLAPRMVM